MTCTECGASLDPTVIHVRHFGCSADDWDDCDCPEVCADCCTGPGCPTREPQETNVTDLVACIRAEAEIAARHGQTGRLDVIAYEVADLIALVEQVRKERDAAHAVIRRLLQGAKPKMTLGDQFHRWEMTTIGGDEYEPMSPAEVDAMRQARTTTQEADHD